MAVQELSRVNNWLLGRFHSDLPLVTEVGNRFYADQAPQNALAPMVVYAFLGGSDKTLTSTNRLSQAIYLIRALAEGSSYDLVADMADRIEAALVVPNQGTIIDEVRITSCLREQPFQRKDSERGIPIVYMGGFYRIKFQPSNQ